MEYELIRNIALFASMNDKDLLNIQNSLRETKIKQGDSLFRKGDEGTSLYIVKSGTVKIVLPSAEGNEIIVTIFSKGDYFGEMSLVDEEPRSADAIAMEETELYVLKRSDFLSFLQSNVEAIKSVLSVLSKRLRRTDELLEDTCFLNISARLAKKLIELAEKYGKVDGKTVYVDLGLTQKELGDTIGATRESINKELKSLREKGLVQTEGNKIRILDIEELKRRVY
ncbi:MAG: Crp/Fnr family transcriptional regulator [Desulfobacterales bacterium]|nr:Crp/Fnr family transcriptional regulator [Desulfobacterales bacterium]MCP4158799.1 Crp/Fnr family transcriptional regulator [Deltaproteobacteria bacterium]